MSLNLRKLFQTKSVGYINNYIYFSNLNKNKMNNSALNARQVLINSKEMAHSKEMQFVQPLRDRSAHYLVPFFLKLFDIEKNELTTAIEQTIVNLDDLAIQIDSIIDGRGYNCSRVDITTFPGLEKKILDCFTPLIILEIDNSVITETIDNISLSFYYNTIERAIIYSLSEGEISRKCTTIYLQPLVRFLSTQNVKKPQTDDLFALISNYIQLVDDFIDLYVDIDANVKTPVTEKFLELERDFNNGVNAFGRVSEIVQKKLHEYYKNIEALIITLCGENISKNALYDWRVFHDRLSEIKIPFNANRQENTRYLKIVTLATPKIFCYTN